MVPSTSYVPTRQKRSYEEDDDDDMDDMDTQPQKQREPNGNTHRLPFLARYAKNHIINVLFLYGYWQRLFNSTNPKPSALFALKLT